MGSWATAKIAFGFDLGDEKQTRDIFLTPQVNYPGEGLNEDEGETWHDYDIANIYDEWAALQKGMIRPALKSDQWKEFTQVANQFHDEYPLELVHYNTYGNYGRYFLALKSTVQKGYQDKPQAISTYDVSPNIFKEYCERFNVPYQEPGWNMLCHYG
jgi:hypothetical protein